MHIPVRLGLVGASGRALPLTLEGENATGPDERVLELTDAEQTLRLCRCRRSAAAVAGRGFSAPANFKTPLDRKGRAALMAHDSDAFNRWEAGQTLATEVLLEMAAAAQAGGACDRHNLSSHAIGEVLARAEDDPAFAAQMLMPPPESELALAMRRRSIPTRSMPRAWR